MLITTIIIAVVFAAIFVIALGFRQWINPKSPPIASSCALENGELKEDGTCAKCEIKDLVDCPEAKTIESIKSNKNKTDKQSTNMEIISYGLLKNCKHGTRTFFKVHLPDALRRR